MENIDSDYSILMNTWVAEKAAKEMQVLTLLSLGAGGALS